MKQRPFLCAIFAALFLVMSACGASSANSAMDMADAAAAEPAEAPAMEEVATDEAYTEEAAEGAAENAAAGGTTESTGLIQGTEVKLALLWVVLLLAHDYIALGTDVSEWFHRFKKPVRYAFYFALLFIVLYSRQLGEYSFVYFQF